MTFAIHGLPVARGIAIGRAVLMSGRVDVAHYFVPPERVEIVLDRTPLYASVATDVIETSGRSVRQVVDEVARALDVATTSVPGEEGAT